MRPLQFWLPTCVSSLGDPAVSADIERAFQHWQGARTLWLLPDINAPYHWSEGPTDYDIVQEVPSTRLERVDIYHVTDTGVAWGSCQAKQFPADWNLGTLLTNWLDAFRQRARLRLARAQSSRTWWVPRRTGDRVAYEERECPITPICVLPSARLEHAQGVFRVQWPLEGMPAPVSLEAETAKYYSLLERHELAEGVTSISCVEAPADGFPLPVEVVWPPAWHWLFPHEGENALDACVEQETMCRVATRSSEDLAKALQAARAHTGRYITEGTTWQGFVHFFPAFVVGGEQYAFQEAHKHNAPSIQTWQTAVSSSRWNSWLKMPIDITRVWGPIGLFWALLIDELEQKRPYRVCKLCHRLIQGKKSKQYCGEHDDRRCYTQRRARDKHEERVRRRQTS